MKQVHFLSLLLSLLIATNFASCSKEDDTPKAGISEYSWTDDKPLEISIGNPVNVSFTAAGDWKASTRATWCNISPESGNAGKSTLKIQAIGSSNNTRTTTVTLTVSGYPATTFEVTQQAGGGAAEDIEVNAKVDEYLRKMYLWNDEYKTLDLDFNQNYEDFFYGALGSMTTNTLDKKPTSDGKYTLFSYIEKRNPVSETRSTKLVDKELAYSFGITGIYPIMFGNETQYTLYLIVQGTYPNSPAEEAGIRRGSMIYLVNGNKLTMDNWYDYYYQLLLPDAGTNLRITAEHKESDVPLETEMAARAMYCNPVIYQHTVEEGGHKIGYLVYASFDAGFDEELFNAFKTFKQDGITDLILDLRYNGGGHTLSANLIASCIAGTASIDKVFNTLRFNEERMQQYTEKERQDLFAYKNYSNLGTSLAAGGLGLKRVYCLVGNNTASASELVINALRGIDIEVILIGETTTGKNVGMEYEDMEIGENTYRVVPITFQSYNAKGFGDYENGFEPDVYIDETNPKNEDNIFYVYRPYGSNEESLYAKAIEQITGKNPMPDTRAISTPALRGRALHAPSIYRPGYDGMLMKRKTNE